MDPEAEKQKIRDAISLWLKASAENDLETVLSLMAEDVIFLLPGREPMRGKAAYAQASRAGALMFQIEGKPDIREIHLAGDYAFVWNFLSITLTPLPAGEPKQRAGDVLSVFRKEPDGRWVLFRDANLLT